MQLGFTSYMDLLTV